MFLTQLVVYKSMAEADDCPVDGLIILKDFITERGENTMLTYIYNKTWSKEDGLIRRTQQYGWIYNYFGGPLEKTRPLPAWIDPLISLFVEDGIIMTPPDQLTINEYTPGQGISWHSDSRLFGDTIISLSLRSACTFEFERYNQVFPIYLTPRTLVIMTEDARYKWRHRIPARASDQNSDGARIKRGTRVSLTFRWLAKQ